MPGSLLLDTNIVIALLAGDAGVRHRLAEADLTFLSSTVLGELHYGARNSTHVKDNLAKIDALAARSAILPVDAATAWHYGRIKSALRAKGRPIPENDIWIASVAEQYDLTLVTRDEHFKEVEAIKVEKW